MNTSHTTIGAAVIVAALGMTACSDEPQRATPSAAPGTDYRDGEYSATGWYGSLPSHHDVTVIIDDSIVTAVEITTPAEDQTSLGYQQRFAIALLEAIIGRNIEDIEVDRLAGSSGCSEGFMDALSAIKDQASDGTQ